MKTNPELKKIDRKIALLWRNLKKEGTTQKQRSKWLDKIAELAIQRLDICLQTGGQDG